MERRGVKLLDARTGKEEVSFAEATTDLNGGWQAFSPDGRFFASGCGDGTVLTWDTKTGRVDRTFRGLRFAAARVFFSPDSQRIGALSQIDGILKVWDATTDQEARTLKGKRAATSIAFSPNGQLLAIPNYDPAAKTAVDVCKFPTGEDLFALGRVTEEGQGMVRSVAFSPDGRHLATGETSGG